MRTPILYRVHRDSAYPNRASFSGDDGCRDVAKFWPAHTETGTRVLDLMRGKTKPFTQHVPDAVAFYSANFEFKRGQTDRAKVIPPEYVDALDKIDQQIEALTRQRRDLLNEAWRHGRPLRIDDVKQGGNDGPGV